MFGKENISFAFVLGLVLVASAVAQKNGECEGDNKCLPNYSSFFDNGNGTTRIDEELRIFTSKMVDKSFKFLFMSSSFNKHDMDRPGFKKLYRKISDKAWEDALDLVKYQNRRGSERGYLGDEKVNDKLFSNMLDASELLSLKTALDFEKTMAKNAHNIHKKVSHDHHIHGATTKSINYDPDVAHYLDEKIINYQSGVIRDLAGYVQTLKNFDNDKTAGDLGVHIFDEYLDKTL